MCVGGVCVCVRVFFFYLYSVQLENFLFFHFDDYCSDYGIHYCQQLVLLFHLSATVNHTFTCTNTYLFSERLNLN